METTLMKRAQSLLLVATERPTKRAWKPSPGRVMLNVSVPSRPNARRRGHGNVEVGTPILAASAVATERPTKRAWKRGCGDTDLRFVRVATERPTKRAWKPLRERPYMKQASRDRTPDEEGMETGGR